MTPHRSRSAIKRLCLKLITRKSVGWFATIFTHFDTWRSMFICEKPPKKHLHDGRTAFRNKAMLIGLGCLAALSLLLTLWQWLAAFLFPLHKRISNPVFIPPISILKPLKGLDDNTIECLQSWLRQEYTGPVQILFGVASAEDPVCRPLRELLRQNPGANAQLVVCGKSL